MKRTAVQAWQRCLGGLLASVAVAALLSGCGSGSSTPKATKSSPTSASAASGPSTTVHYAASVVAQAKVPSVAVFDTSAGTTPSKTLPSPQPSGSPLVFLVQGEEGSRLHVLLPIRPNGPYGPYAYARSGYSDVLTDFAGGDGVIGIHGTNDPSAIGHDVSHGCIRMSNAGITKLAQTLPLGVPVAIQA